MTTAPPKETRPEETRVGPYVLKQALGKGGSGQVYLAWKDNPTGEPLPCVVKFPLHSHATDSDAKAHFWREARLAMRLGNHNNIVHVFDVGLHKNSMPFLAMEYVDGQDLGHLLKTLRRRQRPLSLASVYNILASVTSGLHHAHSARTIDGEPVRIVHRDVTPSNILVNQGGVVKLLDFGIGVAMAEGTTGSHLRGTYRYMSPEHLGGQVCPEMDIYSLGVVAWEMVENRVFRAECEGITHMPAIMDGSVPEMEHDDQRLVRIIMSCLERYSRNRPNAAELYEALARWAKNAGYDRDPAVLEQELAPIMGRHRPSGASGKNLAAPAPPELIATLAAVQQAADAPESTASHPVSEIQWEIISGQRREKDAPRVYRRRKGSPLEPEEANVAELRVMSEVVHPAAETDTASYEMLRMLLDEDHEDHEDHPLDATGEASQDRPTDGTDGEQAVDPTSSPPATRDREDPSRSSAHAEYSGPSECSGPSDPSRPANPSTPSSSVAAEPRRSRRSPERPDPAEARPGSSPVAARLRWPTRLAIAMRHPTSTPEVVLGVTAAVLAVLVLVLAARWLAVGDAPQADDASDPASPTAPAPDPRSSP